MTICISVKVSEGIVLAADSAGAITGSLREPSSKNPPSTGVLKTYDHFRKLLHIKDYPIGTLSWGIALIGARTVESLIKEYEYSLPSLSEELNKSKERRICGDMGRDQAYKYSVKAIAEGLQDHIRKFYESEFVNLNKDNRPPVGILVSGYSSDQFFPEQWIIEPPFSAELKQIRPDGAGKPDFGSNWFGLTDAIIRLHWGRDDSTIKLVADKFKLPVDSVSQVLNSFQYPVIFDGMPLQDAIDYAVYLANVVIGRFRFVVGAPLCGGEIDVAVITPNTFAWIKRKSWAVGGTK
jgi:hypothetical protein